MNVPEIKTVQSQAAVNKILKTRSKSFDYGVSFNVPKEFIEKRNYMQSDEFIKDAHNVMMLNMADDLMEFRNGIKQEISEMNVTLKGKLTQGINGFARMKADLDKNYSLNFDDEPSINTEPNRLYRLVRNIRMFVVSNNLFIK